MIHNRGFKITKTLRQLYEKQNTNIENDSENVMITSMTLY